MGGMILFEEFLVDGPFHGAGEEEDCPDDGKEEWMLILVPEYSIADKECNEHHIDRHGECGDTSEESESEEKTGDQLGTFSKICHEFGG